LIEGGGKEELQYKSSYVCYCINVDVTSIMVVDGDYCILVCSNNHIANVNSHKDVVVVAVYKGLFYQHQQVSYRGRHNFWLSSIVVVVVVVVLANFTVVVVLANVTMGTGIMGQWCGICCCCCHHYCCRCRRQYGGWRVVII